MAEASIDIRIFPNKELTSVDMAEVLDAAIMNTGVIQGCELTLVNGVFHINSGRLIVKGRLGVVSEGTIPNPTTLSQKETCWPLAVCDLSSDENPFYFLLATGDDLDRLGLSTEDQDTTFNVQDGIAALTFGDCEVDPATGWASNFHPYGQATAKKGWDWYISILNEIERVDQYYNDKLTWKIVKGEYTGTSKWVTVPASAKEIIVTVFIAYNASNKASIEFHLPVNDVMWTTTASLFTHVNHWASTNDGFVQIRTMKNADGRHVKLYKAFNQNTDVTENTTWLVWYR